MLAVPANGLPFRLTAYQLFHLALFRSTRVIAGLLRLFRLDLLARGSLGFLTFVFAQLFCVCHDCSSFPLMFSLIGSGDTDLKTAGLKNALPTDNGTTPPSEGRKTVRRSPAFNVVAPPHRPVFVRLEHAGIHRRHQLDIRTRLTLRIAVPHRPRLQAVPNLAIARVM